jgi:hypothetical protein
METPEESIDKGNNLQKITGAAMNLATGKYSWAGLLILMIIIAVFYSYYRKR